MKILYLHNRENWAIHNVGKLWFPDNLLPDLTVTFSNYREITSEKDFDKYDFIWFGYFFIYTKFNYNPEKSIVAIHDPIELFPEVFDWKENLPNQQSLEILHKLRRVVTISHEMHNILKENNLETTLIHTMSLLPTRELNELKTSKCSIHSVFQTYPRKNPQLMEELKNFVDSNLSLQFDRKIGLDVLPEDDYIKLLDDHEIYVCTSSQEGGPLPAMDAMHRGSVVITTPVGQVQEFIVHGENGYICNDLQDFIEVLRFLKNNLKQLHKMRLQSLASIQKARNKEEINTTIENLIKQL